MHQLIIKNTLLVLCLIAGLNTSIQAQQIIGMDSSESKITVYTIGDSTMANKKAGVYPETGWGQVLPAFFDNGIEIRNRALNGRSSKSFIDQNHWKEVLDSLKEGDYVFIQFGHNDQKIQDSTRYTEPFSSYRINIERFVRETREKRAFPILFTSIVRRKFENGLLCDTHGKYPEIVRQVAAEMSVPLIDLQRLTAEAVIALGDKASRKLYLWTLPSTNFPDGRKDDTHLSIEGANLVARLAMQQLILFDNSLAQRIRIN